MRKRRLPQPTCRLLLMIVFTAMVVAAAEDQQALSLSISCPGLREAPRKPPTGAEQGPRYIVRAGMPLTVRYTVSNRGREALSVSQRHIRAVPRSFEIRAEDGRRVTSQREINVRSQPGDVIAIPAGKSISRQANVLELFPPEASLGRGSPILYEPGRYTIQMRFRLPGGQQPATQEPLWAGTLESNVLEVTIEGLSGKERDTLWAGFRQAEEAAERVRLALLLSSTMGGKWDARLLGLLDDGDASLRIVAILALAAGKPADCAAPLESKLLQDKDPLVRSYAADALGKLGGRQSVPALIRAVASRQERSYRAAIRALGELGDPRAIPVLRQVADSEQEEEWVRKAALESMRKIKRGATRGTR